MAVRQYATVAVAIGFMSCRNTPSRPSVHLLLRAYGLVQPFADAAIIFVPVQEVGRLCQGCGCLIRRPLSLVVWQRMGLFVEQKVLELLSVIVDVPRESFKFRTSHRMRSMPTPLISPSGV